MRFTIRDLLWLMVVVAISLGWVFSLRRQAAMQSKFTTDLTQRALTWQQETRERMKEEIYGEFARGEIKLIDPDSGNIEINPKRSDNQP